MVSPNGIFISSAQTRFWKSVPFGARGKSKLRRSPAKNSSSWRATWGLWPLSLALPSRRLNAVTAPLSLIEAHAGPNGVSSCIVLVSFQALFETGPNVICCEAAVGREPRHYLANFRLTRAFADEATETLSKPGIAGWQAIRKAQAAEEGVLDGPRTDTADVAQEA